MSDQASTALPPGLTPEQLAAHERRVAARERAATVPLPGLLGEAFATCAAPSPNGSVPLAHRMGEGPGVRAPLRPVSLRDFITLRAWQHPLYDELCGAEPREWTPNELDQAIALFSPSVPSVTSVANDFRALFHQAFSTILSFVPVQQDGSITISSGPEDGVGWWLSLYRFLVLDCHFASDAALDYPLCQAWALRAAHHDRNPRLEMDGDGYIAQEVMRNA